MGFPTSARSPGPPLSLLLRPSLVQRDYKNSSPSSTGPGFCLRQTSPGLIFSKRLGEDTPRHREGPKPCLHDIRVSLRLVTIAHQGTTSLTASGLDIIALGNITHEGERNGFPLRAFTSTKPASRLPLMQPGRRVRMNFRLSSRLACLNQSVTMCWAGKGQTSKARLRAYARWRHCARHERASNGCTWSHTLQCLSSIWVKYS